MQCVDVGLYVGNARCFRAVCRRVRDVLATRWARTRLLADAEAGKNAAQEVLGGELAGDLVQGLLGAAELFGDELAGAAVL